MGASRDAYSTSSSACTPLQPSARAGRQRREQHRAQRLTGPDQTVAGQPRGPTRPDCLRRSATSRGLAPLPFPRANGVQNGRQKKGDPRAKKQEIDAIQHHHAPRPQCIRVASPYFAAPSISGRPPLPCLPNRRLSKATEFSWSIGHNDIEAVPLVYPESVFVFFEGSCAVRASS